MPAIKMIKLINRKYLVVFFILLILNTNNLYAQGYTIIESLASVPALSYTGDKPQSKVWNYSGYWWTVIPVSTPAAGTYLFRLDGTTWTQLQLLDTQTDIKADVKSVGGITHILLKQKNENTTGGGALKNQPVKLISIEFVAGSPPTYQLWSSRNTTVTFNIQDYAETATIDIDSQGKMWLASDGGGSSATANKNIYVMWSASPYSNWNGPINLATGVSPDDICVITSFDGDKIGVLWSDQISTRFLFTYRNDSDPVTTWQTIEQPYFGSTGDIADDHLNFAVDSRDGTIYAAVKTSLDNLSGSPRIVLLVRNNSVWSHYTVDTNPAGGTRPIALLDEQNNIITVCYTATDGQNLILFKESPINSITFPPAAQNLSSLNIYNNSTTTKQSVGDESVVLFSTGGNAWTGVKTYRPAFPTDNGAGYAFKLNGTINQAIVVNKTSILRNIHTAITLEAWVKPNATADQQIINYLDDPNSTGNNNEGYSLYLTSTGKVGFNINRGLSILTSVSNYQVGKWTHIAATYDKQLMKIYIDGFLDNSIAYTDDIGDHSNDFVIGAQRVYPGTSYNQEFNGTFDEIRLWNDSHTIDEIRADMCTKINVLDMPTTLVAYWNFDDPKGFTIEDVTNNSNIGSMFNISDFRYEWSGAPIGNASEYDYTATGGNYTQQIGSTDGDFMEVTAPVSSGATGIQIYRADSPSMRGPVAGGRLPGSTITPFDTISPLRFYGVKVLGTGTPTYTAVYHYLGHPGISDETKLKLGIRDNLADNSWDDANASLNTSQNTLTRSGLTGNELALASTANNPLPVQLAYFNGSLTGDYVNLNWKTETEVSNYGFEIEKSWDGSEFSKIAFVEGHGNSNSPHSYSYSDRINSLNGKIYYRLKQIDTDGGFSYSDIINVDLGVPDSYELSQNYPNPFNPNTRINYQIPEKSRVVIRVFNILGEQVKELVNDILEAGYYNVDFNSKDLASGVYVYTISANQFFASKKMLLVK